MDDDEIRSKKKKKKKKKSKNELNDNEQNNEEYEFSSELLMKFLLRINYNNSNQLNNKISNWTTFI